MTWALLPGLRKQAGGGGGVHLGRHERSGGTALHERLRGEPQRAAEVGSLPAHGTFDRLPAHVDHAMSGRPAVRAAAKLIRFG